MSSKTAVARFNQPEDPELGVLSPLSPQQLVVRHKQYLSLHHYFLCERFRGSPYEERIHTVSSMWELERLVKEAEAKNCQHDDWNRVKIDVMLLGNYFKFQQNEAARRVLLSTDDKVLVYHTAADDFWGDCDNGTGRNMLGVVLMSVRERLRRRSATSAAQSSGQRSRSAKK